MARTSGVEQSATLTKSLHEKEIALQRAEQKAATVEAKFDEHKKATLGDRALLEEKIANERSSSTQIRCAPIRGGCPAQRAARTQRATSGGHDVAAELLAAETESQTVKSRG